MHVANVNWCELDLGAQVTNSENISIGVFKDQQFDVVIGTDIVYWP